MNDKPPFQKSSLIVVREEIERASADLNVEVFETLVGALAGPERRWFFTGQGRSGLLARMAAMRLMHLGRRVHVVGETTTPAIRAEDVLLVVSGSGRTQTSVRQVELAKAEGATIVSVVSQIDSELARLADTLVLVAVPDSAQQGNTLFEQITLALFDAALLELVCSGAASASSMTDLHANLE